MDDQQTCGSTEEGLQQWVPAFQEYIFDGDSDWAEFAENEGNVATHRLSTPIELFDPTSMQGSRNWHGAAVDDEFGHVAVENLQGPTELVGDAGSFNACGYEVAVDGGDGVGGAGRQTFVALANFAAGAGPFPDVGAEQSGAGGTAYEVRSGAFSDGSSAAVDYGAQRGRWCRAPAVAVQWRCAGDQAGQTLTMPVGPVLCPRPISSAAPGPSVIKPRNATPSAAATDRCLSNGPPLQQRRRRRTRA